MEPKGGSSAVAVTAEAVKQALGRPSQLTAAEEKTLRMRYGAPAADPRAPLPQAHGGNEELKDELLVLELQLMRSYRAHRAGAETVMNRTVSGVDSKAKD